MMLPDSRCGSIRAAAAGGLLLLATGCLSSNPPLAIRVFDPMPRARELLRGFDTPTAAVGVQVLGGPGLRREMLWRISDVEVAFDELNQWSVEPAVMMRTTLETVFPVPADTFGRAAADLWVCEVIAFDNLLDPGPAAKLHVRLRPDPKSDPNSESASESGAAATRPVDIVVSTRAASVAPADLARAMAKSLADVTRQVAAQCAPGG